MSDTPISPDPLPVDASGQPLGEDQPLPPEQPPMSDDASGLPTEKTDTDDLFVQGGE